MFRSMVRRAAGVATLAVLSVSLSVQSRAGQEQLVDAESVIVDRSFQIGRQLGHWPYAGRPRVTPIRDPRRPLETFGGRTWREVVHDEGIECDPLGRAFGCLDGIVLRRNHIAVSFFDPWIVREIYVDRGYPPGRKDTWKKYTGMFLAMITVHEACHIAAGRPHGDDHEQRDFLACESEWKTAAAADRALQQAADALTRIRYR